VFSVILGMTNISVLFHFFRFYFLQKWFESFIWNAFAHALHSKKMIANLHGVLNNLGNDGDVSSGFLSPLLNGSRKEEVWHGRRSLLR